ncbi:MAG: HAMP domain-containing histidine kinase [Butyrivibrio sp.]|nr:HAMP domain-containing histidine kinase [Muribaculum sp.]MCM1552547.1 HAMP domain-containing histidine kinase [Butyrivibrio sp.]
MGKIKGVGMRSVKWSFFIYFPICLVLAYLGAFGIGIGTNYLQDWYSARYSMTRATPDGEQYHVYYGEDGVLHYEFVDEGRFSSESRLHEIVYWFISNAQVVLAPLWVIGSIALMAVLFYRRELEQPINALIDASEKISDNCLDFQLESGRRDELGKLMESFETMRQALYHNNQKTWRLLEERRRLNAAFAHDMRTPITVLKGYVELLDKYIPDGKVSREKLLEILQMMGAQINRLESYTARMNRIQRVEDISPAQGEVTWEELCGKCRESCGLLAGTLQMELVCEGMEDTLWVDEELVLEVLENLLSNAIRYARNRIRVDIRARERRLEIVVEDDGVGFSQEALQRAGREPGVMERREKGETQGEHFGLGLYICRIVCEKCGGELLVENGSGGGRVMASFEIRKDSDNAN